MKKIRKCKRCDRPCSYGPNHTRPPGVMRSHSRELCHPCWTTVWRQGKLDDYPKKNRTREEFLEDYEFLRAQGLTRAEIADRMHVTRDAIYIALKRAQANG